MLRWGKYVHKIISKKSLAIFVNKWIYLFTIHSQSIVYFVTNITYDLIMIFPRYSTPKIFVTLEIHMICNQCIQSWRQFLIEWIQLKQKCKNEKKQRDTTRHETTCRTYFVICRDFVLMLYRCDLARKKEVIG